MSDETTDTRRGKRVQSKRWMWREALSGAARGGGRPSGTARDLAPPGQRRVVDLPCVRACLSVCVRACIDPSPDSPGGGTSCQKPAVPRGCQLWERSRRGNVNRYDIGERGCCILGDPGVPRPTIPSIQPILLVFSHKYTTNICIVLLTVHIARSKYIFIPQRWESIGTHMWLQLSRITVIFTMKYQWKRYFCNPILLEELKTVLFLCPLK